MFIIINQWNKTISYYDNEIQMGFSLDYMTDYLDRLELNYKIRRYNNGRVISIR